MTTQVNNVRTITAAAASQDAALWQRVAEGRAVVTDGSYRTLVRFNGSPVGIPVYEFVFDGGKFGEMLWLYPYDAEFTVTETATALPPEPTDAGDGRWCIKERRDDGEDEIHTVYKDYEGAVAELEAFVAVGDVVQRLSTNKYLFTDDDGTVLMWIEPFVPVPAEPSAETVAFWQAHETDGERMTRLQADNARLRALVADAAAALEAVNDAFNNVTGAVLIASMVDPETLQVVLKYRGHDGLRRAADVLARLRTATSGGA